jgi:mono/diheme cytochrome c family protein
MIDRSGLPCQRCIRWITFVAALVLGASGCVGPTVPPPQVASSDRGAAARGGYLAKAANCEGCHTDRQTGSARFAGGRGIPTPFGVYYSGNITPDPTYGIGAWSDTDFLRALRQGVMPSGAYYFPAFPFPAFSLMTDRDILDIKAYLVRQMPVAEPDRAPAASFPFDVRATMAPWRLLYFEPGPYIPDPSQSSEWNRGAYLANAVGHCGECHTPRGALGALDNNRRFAGTMSASTGVRAPNITADRAHGIGAWSVDDITDLLKIGIAPSGDFASGSMAEVVEGTSQLTDADRRAIAVYTTSVRPLPSGTGMPGS